VSLDIGRQFWTLVPSDVRLGYGSIAAAAARTHVGSKTYRFGETIDQVSSVLRGIKRISQALDNHLCREALDIAQRFSWPATRSLLMCSIYAAAKEKNDDDMCHLILNELGYSR
jgi:hypothetical protein